MEVNQRVREMEVSIIRQIAQKCAKLPDSINLTIGEPDIKTPEIVTRKTAEYMMENQLSYAPLGGVPELREEIVSFYKRKYGIEYSPDEVIVTVGSTEALSSALKGILSEGDEVVVILPAFSLYEALLKLYGVKPVFIDTSKNDFRLTPEMLEDAITDKTKAVILNYPTNPTGVILTKEETEGIAKVLEKRDIFILSDEIYSEMIFEGEEFYSIAKCENVKDQVIVINGFSKSHSMTGWRVGYLLTHAKFRKELIKVSQYTVTSPATLSQIGGIIALKEAEDVREVAAEYEKRAKFVCERLEEMGFDVVIPKATFYVYAGYKKISDKDSLEFALEILDKTGVALVPGKAFSTEGYIRIACTKGIQLLEEAMDRMESYIRNLKK
jgi:aminotransferase